MAEKVDYAALKKGGFMRQKQKGCFSLQRWLKSMDMDMFI